MANLGSLYFEAGIKPDYSGLEALEKRLEALKTKHTVNISFDDLESRIESISKSLRMLQVAHGATFSFDGLSQADKQAAEFTQKSKARFDSIQKSLYELSKHASRYGLSSTSYDKTIKELQDAINQVSPKNITSTGEALDALKRNLSGIIPELNASIGKFKEMQSVLSPDANIGGFSFDKRIKTAMQSIEMYKNLFADLEKLSSKGDKAGFGERWESFINSKGANALGKIRKELRWISENSGFDFTPNKDSVKIAIPEAVIEKVYVKKIELDSDAVRGLGKKISELIGPVSVNVIPIIDHKRITDFFRDLRVPVVVEPTLRDDSDKGKNNDKGKKVKQAKSQVDDLAKIKDSIDGNANFFDIDGIKNAKDKVLAITTGVGKAFEAINTLYNTLNGNGKGIDTKFWGGGAVEVKALLSTLEELRKNLGDLARTGDINLDKIVGQFTTLGPKVFQAIEQARGMVAYQASGGKVEEVLRSQVEAESKVVSEEKKLAELRKNIADDLLLKGQIGKVTALNNSDGKLTTAMKMPQIENKLAVAQRQITHSIEQLELLKIDDKVVSDTLLGSQPGSLKTMGTNLKALLESVAESLRNVGKLKNATFSSDAKGIDGKRLFGGATGYVEVFKVLRAELETFMTRYDAAVNHINGTKAFQFGGRFYGIGTETSDDNTIKISDKEFVVTAKAISSTVGAFAQLANAMAGGRAESSALISALNTLRQMRPDVGAFKNAFIEIVADGKITTKTIKALNKAFGDMSNANNFKSVGDMERYNAALNKLVSAQTKLDEAIGREKGDDVIKKLAKEADEAREAFKTVLSEVTIEPKVNISVKPENTKATVSGGSIKPPKTPAADIEIGDEDEPGGLKAKNLHLYQKFNAMMVDLIQKRDQLNAKGKNTDNISEIITRYSQWLLILRDADTAMQKLANEEARLQSIADEGGDISMEDKLALAPLQEKAEWAQKMYDLYSTTAESFRRQSKNALGWDSVRDTQERSSAREVALANKNSKDLEAQEARLIEQEKKKAEAVRSANNRLRGWLNNLDMAVDSMSADAVSKYTKGSKTDKALQMLTSLRDRMQNVMDKYLAGIISPDNLLRFVDKAKTINILGNTKRQASDLRNEQRRDNAPDIKEEIKAFNDLDAAIKSARDRLVQLRRDLGNRRGKGQDASFIEDRIREFSDNELVPLLDARNKKDAAVARAAVEAYNNQKEASSQATSDVLSMQNEYNRSVAAENKENEKARTTTKQRIEGEIAQLELLKRAYADTYKTGAGKVFKIDNSAARAEIDKTIASLKAIKSFGGKVRNRKWAEYVNSKEGSLTRSRAEQLSSEEERKINTLVIPLVRARAQAYKELQDAIKAATNDVQKLKDKIALNKADGLDTALLERRADELEKTRVEPLTAVANDPSAGIAEMRTALDAYRKNLADVRRETKVIVKEQEKLNKPVKSYRNTENNVKREIDSLKQLLNEYKDVEKTINGKPISFDFSKSRGVINQLIAELEQAKQSLSGKALKQFWADYSQQGRGTLGRSQARQLAREMQRVTTEMAKAKGESEDFQRNIQGLGQEIKILGRFGSEISTIFQQAFSVYAVRNFANSIIKVGGEIQKQRIAMGSILQDEYKADTIYGQMRSLAVRSPFGIADLNTFSKQLSAYSIPYNELYDTMKRLADISAGVGVDMGRVVLAYGQIRAAKFLRGQELRQLTEANIPILDKLVANLSKREGRVVSPGDVINMISKKQVSFKDVQDALWEMTNSGGIFYNMQEKMADSLAAKWKNLGDAIELIYADMADSDFGEWLKGVAATLTSIARQWKIIGSLIIAAAATTVIHRLSLLAINKHVGNLTDEYKKQLLADKEKTAQLLRTKALYSDLTREERLFLKNSKKVTGSDLLEVSNKKKMRLDELENRRALSGPLSKELEAERQSLLAETRKTKELATQLYLRGEITREQLRSIRSGIGMSRGEYNKLTGSGKRNSAWNNIFAPFKDLGRGIGNFLTKTSVRAKGIFNSWSKDIQNIRSKAAAGTASDFERRLAQRSALNGGLYLNSFKNGMDPLYFRNHAAESGLSFGNLKKMLSQGKIDSAQFRAGALGIGIDPSTIAKTQLLLAQTGTAGQTAYGFWQKAFLRMSSSFSRFGVTSKTLLGAIGGGIASLGSTALSLFVNPFTIVLGIIEGIAATINYYADRAKEFQRIQDETVTRAQEGFKQLDESSKTYRVGLSIGMSSGELVSAIEELRNKLKDYDPEWQNTFKIAFEVTDDGEYVKSAADRYEILAKRLNEVKTSYEDLSGVAAAVKLANDATDNFGPDDMLNVNLKELQDAYKELDTIAMSAAKHMSILGDIIGNVADKNEDFKRALLKDVLGHMPNGEELSKNLSEYKITPTKMFETLRKFPKIATKVNASIKGMENSSEGVTGAFLSAGEAFHKWYSYLSDDIKDAEKEAMEDAKTFVEEFKLNLAANNISDKTNIRLGIEPWLNENGINDNRVQEMIYDLLEKEGLIAKVDIEFNEPSGKDFTDFEKLMHESLKAHALTIDDFIDTSKMSAATQQEIRGFATAENEAIKRLVNNMDGDIIKFFNNINKEIERTRKQMKSMSTGVGEARNKLASQENWLSLESKALSEVIAKYEVLEGKLGALVSLREDANGGLPEWTKKQREVLEKELNIQDGRVKGLDSSVLTEESKNSLTLLQTSYEDLIKTFQKTADDKILPANIFEIASAVRSEYSKVTSNIDMFKGHEGDLSGDAKDLYEAAIKYKGVLEEMARIGGYSLGTSNSGGSVKDPLEKEIRDRMKILDRAYSEYKKLVKIIQEDNNFSNIEDVRNAAFDKLKEYNVFEGYTDYIELGSSGLENIRKSYRNLLEMTKRITDEELRKSLQSELNLKNLGVDSDEASKLAGFNAELLNRKMEEEGRKWDFFKTLIESGIDIDSAKTIAGVDKAASSYAQYLRQSLEKEFSDSNSEFSVDKLLSMSDTEVSESVGNKAIANKVKALRDNTDKMKQEIEGVYAEALKETQTYLDKRQAIENEYADLIEKIDYLINNETDSEKKKTLELEKQVLLKKKVRDISRLNYTQLKEDPEVAFTMNNLDKAGTAQLEKTLDKIREKYIEAIKSGNREVAQEAAKDYFTVFGKLASKKPFVGPKKAAKELEAARDAYDLAQKKFEEAKKTGSVEEISAAEKDVELTRNLLDEAGQTVADISNDDFWNMFESSGGVGKAIAGVGKLASSISKFVRLSKIEGTDKGALVKGLVGDGLSMLGSVSAYLTEIIGKVKELAEATGDVQLAELADSMGAVLQNFQAAGEGAAKGGWVGAIIGGVTDMINQTVNAFFQARLEAAELIQNTKDFARALTLLELKVDDKKFSNVFGENSIGKAVEAYKNAQNEVVKYRKYMHELSNEFGNNYAKYARETQVDIRRNAPNLAGEVNQAISSSNNSLGSSYNRKGTSRGYDQLGNMAVKTKDYSGWANFWGKKDKYTLLKDLAPQLWDENGELIVENAKAFLETNTQINDEQRKQIQHAIDLKEAYEENMKVVDDLLNEWLGNWSSSLTDTIFDSILNGTDAWDGFKKAGAEAVLAIGKTMLTSTVFNSFFSKYQKEFEEAFQLDNPTYKILEISTKLYDELPTVFDAAKNTAEAYIDAAERYGFDMDALAGSSSSVSNSIKGVTEETADILAAYINGMRLDLSVQRSTVEKIYELMLQQSGTNPMDYVPFEEISSTPSDTVPTDALSTPQSLLTPDMIASVNNSLIYSKTLMESIAYEQLPQFNAIAESQLAQLNMITENTRLCAESAQICADYAEETHNLLSDVANGMKKFSIE